MMDGSGFLKPLMVPNAFRHNPRILRVVQDAYGHLNENFGAGPSQDINGDCVNFMLCENRFVPLTSHPNQTKQMNYNVSSSEPIRPKVIQTYKNIPTSLLSSGNNKIISEKRPIKASNLQKKQVTFAEDSHNASMKNKEVMGNHNTLVTKDDVKSDNKVKNNEDNKVKMENKLLFCTGTIERILKWNRNLKNTFCLYETIAPVVSVQDGRQKQQQIMLLRDKKGPILQVQYYSNTQVVICDFDMGKYLRCVGRMIGYNIMLAESIREAKEDEILNLARLSYVCDYSMAHNSMQTE